MNKDKMIQFFWDNQLDNVVKAFLAGAALTAVANRYKGLHEDDDARSPLVTKLRNLQINKDIIEGV